MESAPLRFLNPWCIDGATGAHVRLDETGEPAVWITPPGNGELYHMRIRASCLSLSDRRQGADTGSGLAQLQTWADCLLERAGFTLMVDLDSHTDALRRYRTALDTALDAGRILVAVSRMAGGRANADIVRAVQDDLHNLGESAYYARNGYRG